MLIEPAVRDFKEKAETNVLSGSNAEFNDDKRFQDAVAAMVQLKEATRGLALHELLAIMADALQPQELIGCTELLLVLLGDAEEVRTASLALLERLKPQIPPLSKQQAKVAFKILEEIRRKVQQLSSAKAERR
eukprot:2470350-Pleurochrysis_carterae.AAC.1